MVSIVMRWHLAWALVAFVVGSPVAAGEALFDAVASGDIGAAERALRSGADVNGRASDQATALILATLGNQPSMVKLLLANGASIDARNSGGFTALHAAAYVGSSSIAELLLGKGAPLDDANNKAGVTPLMVAGEENHPDVAELLIARGADPGHPEIHGYLPITRALWKGNKDIVHIYKQHGVKCPPLNIVGGYDWYQKCLND
jgi:uncharacterized protein